VVVAVTGMTMVGLPTQTEVDIMSDNNKDNCGKQKPHMVIMKNFLEDQKCNSKAKKEYRQKFMVVFIVSMI